MCLGVGSNGLGRGLTSWFKELKRWYMGKGKEGEVNGGLVFFNVGYSLTCSVDQGCPYEAPIFFRCNSGFEHVVDKATVEHTNFSPLHTAIGTSEEGTKLSDKSALFHLQMCTKERMLNMHLFA